MPVKGAAGGRNWCAVAGGKKRKERNDMAYRRRQGIARASTFKEEIYQPPTGNKSNDNNKSSLPAFSSSKSFSASSSASESLAAQAIRASAAHRESSLSSAYVGAGADSAFASDHQRPKGFSAYEHASTRNENTGFWGVIARKAKAILEDDDLTPQSEPPARSRWQMADTSTGGQHSSEGFRNLENPRLRKGLDKLTSSLNQIGDTFEKAFEEGRTIVESKTADIRKLQMRRKGATEEQNQASGDNSPWQPLQPQNQTYHETQLKASRDVAMATAAKAKLLLRELKTVKADLAFAKERCTQLEEENKLLRESREKGQNPADDDLIRLQLETLLAEKARLAHENSIYARENRFLREIVEYHQLTMQDVVYLDEGTEEVTEVYPTSTSPLSKIFSVSPPSSPSSPSEIPPPSSLPVTKEILHVPTPSEETDNDVPVKEVPPSSNAEVPEDTDAKKPSDHVTGSEVPPSSNTKAPEDNDAKIHSVSAA